MDASGVAEQLRMELDRIDAVAADLAQELAEIVASAAADPPDDEHDVEGSSIGFERARLTALLGSTLERRGAVESALAQAVAGEEVACQWCGKPVGTERLLALPGVTSCIACASVTEPSGLRRRRNFGPR